MDMLLKFAFVFLYISCGVSELTNTVPKDVPQTTMNDKLERTLNRGQSIDAASLRTLDQSRQTNTVNLYQLMIRAYNSLKKERESLYELIEAFERESDVEIELMQAIIASIETRNNELEDNIKQGQTGLSSYSASVKEENVKSEEFKRISKRSTFDSISHNGGLGRLGHAESGRRGKLAFTFKNLLPYLIGEHRRNNRASLRRRFRKPSDI